MDTEIFQTTPPSPFQGSDNCLGVHYHRAAVEAWDILESRGYRPATIIDTDIYMRRSDFMKLVDGVGGRCATREEGNHRISSIWVNVERYDLMIQVIFKETLDQDHGKWFDTMNWKPLR